MEGNRTTMAKAALFRYQHGKRSGQNVEAEGAFHFLHLAINGNQRLSLSGLNLQPGRFTLEQGLVAGPPPHGGLKS